MIQELLCGAMWVCFVTVRPNLRGFFAAARKSGCLQGTMRSRFAATVRGKPTGPFVFRPVAPLNAELFGAMRKHRTTFSIPIGCLVFNDLNLQPR